MAGRIRGAEKTVRITIDGQGGEGTWFNITDFSKTERADLTETEHVGKNRDAVDYQHHGWDFSFTVEPEDDASLAFMQSVIARQDLVADHPTITITIMTQYRGSPGGVSVEALYDVVMRQSEDSFSGRKEYVKNQFEGKAENWELIQRQ